MKGVIIVPSTVRNFRCLHRGPNPVFTPSKTIVRHYRANQAVLHIYDVRPGSTTTTTISIRPRSTTGRSSRPATIRTGWIRLQTCAPRVFGSVAAGSWAWASDGLGGGTGGCRQSVALRRAPCARRASAAQGLRPQGVRCAAPLAGKPVRRYPAAHSDRETGSASTCLRSALARSNGLVIVSASLTCNMRCPNARSWTCRPRARCAVTPGSRWRESWWRWRVAPAHWPGKPNTCAIRSDRGLTYTSVLDTLFLCNKTKGV